MKRLFPLFVILLFIFVTGCSRFDRSLRKKEANKKVVLNYWENFYNKKDLNKAFALFADSAVSWSCPCIPHSKPSPKIHPASL